MSNQTDSAAQQSLPGIESQAPSEPGNRKRPETGSKSGPAAGDAPPDAADCLVEVAVPVPLPGALSYAVPESLRGRRLVGCRVEVEVGRRRLRGVVVEQGGKPPAGVRIKPLVAVLDVEPAVPNELLDLARFVADYYLCPLGDAVRALVPTDLPPWGDRRVSLTDAGAIAPPRDATESALVEYLMLHRRARLADLQQRLGLPDLPRVVDRLRRQGRVSIEAPNRRGSGFVKAVELVPVELLRQEPRPLDAQPLDAQPLDAQPLDAQPLDAAAADGDEDPFARVGRSAKGRQVLEYLQALGRPATLRELTTEIGCGRGVIRRLGQLGLVREFTQPERLPLDRHRLDTAHDDGFELRPDQKTAVEALLEGLDTRQYRPFLLHGMTGSGKTVVYTRAVRAALDQGRGAIVMVPEIALVPALASELRSRFGSDLAILHSNLSSAERQQEWERIRAGEARVVVGPRSALWAPVRDLGLVVVDEEHDGSYKQDQAPRYNGRDLALVRARGQKAVAVLVSATPSLESRYNVEHEKLGYLRLTARAGHGQLPEGILVDLRLEEVAKKRGEVFFSGRLQQEIRKAVEAGDQVILLRNRRGYAPVLLCRGCGEDFRCDDCGLNMTYHRRGHRLECHYCSRERSAPSRCPTCDEAALEPMGAGTERVEEAFRELFPGIEVDVLDADASRRTGGAAAVLERFSKGRTQVLVGTQMVSKGHHFPRVSLVGVLFADTYLGFPDFRAVERTYALLTQVAGRAGRGERPGKVVIQTFHPDHYAIRAVLERDDEAFVEQEMHFRRTFHYPPYARMVQVLAQHADAGRAREALGEMARAILARPESRGVRVLGPTPAPFEKLRGKFRCQLVLRGPSGAVVRRLVREAYDGLHPRQRKDLSLDVDPYDLL